MSKSADDEILNSIKKEKLKEMGQQIDAYLDMVDKFLFIEGMTKDEYDKKMAKARKCAERLRKGKKLNKILDVEKIEECIQKDSNFAEEYLDL